MKEFEATIKEIDAINSMDPHQEKWNGELIPKELLYSKRMTEMLQDYWPGASDTLRIAARAQHIQRWAIPRDLYPMDRKGYLQWRTELKKYHGDLTGSIMEKLGYKETDIKKVDDLINKRRLKTDEEAQVLEDVVCLVFLKYYFDDFIQKHEEEKDKIIHIVQKTWNKMSEKGHDAALKLPHSDQALNLVLQALGK